MKRKKKRILRKIKYAGIDYSDIPELSDEQLKKFKLISRRLIEENNQLDIGYFQI